MTAKRTPAKRAASSRTTAASKVANFDTERQRIIKARKGPKTQKWTCYGQVWDIKRPNIAFIADQEGEETIASFLATLTAHIVKDQRADFLKAVAADEDLDFDLLGAMVADMQRLVYGNVKTPE